ncbi:hypothetical protein [Falsiroseomonas tokyonensis]|uniref:Uncharacterized protein n=1 Tax=Falsiroseomonas tokyonensis TaxID=430521 RepID=A0ABV7BS33_9PROT|nr:hypothetical protein [Falsiroseomonas tokyonensis]MBU8538450.1 hypothetical protein [Falsiroseomonas tokyonensis]
MHPRVGRHGKHVEGRGRRGRDQARLGPWPAHACLLLALAGCSGGIPQDADPRYWWRNISGGYLDGREPPPGRDAPYPNLSTVPPRPVPPSAEERAALTAALAADREGSRSELTGAPIGTPTLRGAPPSGTGAAPPAPPTLAAVPPIRLDPVPAPTQPAVAAPPVLAAPVPAPAPLAGPPPAPSGDLFAPPPPPAGDLLAPRRN